MKAPSFLAATLALGLCFITQPASASDRRFAYTESTLTSPAGEVELENWISMKSRPGVIREFKFRHELEIGLTDNTQIGLYLANWKLDARTHSSRYEDSSFEVIHNFTNPVTDFLGSAAYAEVTLGEHSFELEGKLLLEKRFGPWTIAWNGAIEADWDGPKLGDFRNATGELSESLGVSYDLTKSISVGVELLHELPIEKWHNPKDPELYFGPNFTYRRHGFYTTVSVLVQTTERRSEQDVQTRAIVGIEF